MTFPTTCADLAEDNRLSTLTKLVMPRQGVVRFEIFRGVVAGWPELFEKASEFATTLGPERLISISHSEDQQDGVVAVWYWDEDRARRS